MDFIVVDVETANQNIGSICQIGVARFQQDRCSSLWGSLVDPEDSFSAFNIAVHGIRPEHVIDAPNWLEIQGELQTHFAGSILASHTYFDLRAIRSANERYGVEETPWMDWVDTCKVARAVWPQLANHKLSNLARTFGISYQAHNAAEDARCAGEILMLAAQSSGLTMKDLIRANKLFLSGKNQKIHQ